MRIILLVAILIVISIVGYISLPFTYRNRAEISIGNHYIQNINKLRDMEGRLPNTNEHEILKSLMPKEMKNKWSPEYKNLDSINFELVFVSGFDGPYLRYCSANKKWKYGFGCED